VGGTVSGLIGFGHDIALMEEALRIQRTQLPPTDQAILDTEDRLAFLQTITVPPTVLARADEVIE
jgi:hypothetical protein